MLRVSGLPKDTGAATTTKAAEPETLTSAPSTTARSRAAAGPTPIQPAPSTSKTTMSTTITTTVTQPALTISSTTPVRTTTQQVGTVPVQTYSMHHPNSPYQQPIDPNRQACTTQSTTQHAASYTPMTILPTYHDDSAKSSVRSE